MGREALCRCTWAGESAECKVLLETHELILRGAIRRQAPIASLQDVAVDGDRLIFRVGDHSVELLLGAKQAQSWARKIAAPPVTLAGKLGITAEAQMLVLGEVESEALAEALAQATSTSARMPEQVVVCAGSVVELERACSRFAGFAHNPPVWIVYRKGARSELPESLIRTMLRGMGWMDTKVAAVDAAWTALRFNRRA